MSTSDTDSGYGSLDAPSRKMIDVQDFQRLERKLDRVADALNKLVLIEDRQANQKEQILKLETLINSNKDIGEKLIYAIKDSHEKLIEVNRVAIEKVDQKLEKWVQRGIGIGAVLGTVWIIVTWVWK